MQLVTQSHTIGTAVFEQWRTSWVIVESTQLLSAVVRVYLFGFRFRV